MAQGMLSFANLFRSYFNNGSRTQARSVYVEELQGGSVCGSMHGMGRFVLDESGKVCQMVPQPNV